MKRRIEVNEEELLAAADDFAVFDDGTPFVDPSHPFSSDLDVFGPRFAVSADESIRYRKREAKAGRKPEGE